MNIPDMECICYSEGFNAGCILNVVGLLNLKDSQWKKGQTNLKTLNKQSVIVLLGIYQVSSKFCPHKTCTQMFTTGLFLIFKTGSKQHALNR